MGTRNPGARPAVAFFNPIVAHYRMALVRELWGQGASDYVLFADTQDSISGIAAVDLSADRRFRRTPCVRFLDRLTWQSGAVREAAFGNFDTYIFLGNGQWLSTWVAAVVARMRGRRVLFWTHGWTRRDRGMKRYLRVIFYRLANGLLLYGDRARSIGMELGFSSTSLYVMYNSLDFDKQQFLLSKQAADAGAAMRAELFGDPNVPMVIAAARLTTAKRFDLLIRAIGVVSRRHRPVNLLIVGDGPERDRLHHLAFAEGVRVAMVGECYDEERLALLFSAAAVTVSPGNIGLTCMHSLGYGVPVITHDDPEEQGPEYEAVSPGHTGEFFRKGSVDALAASIERWTQSATVPAAVRDRCIATVRERYHASFQRQVMDCAVRGQHFDKALAGA